MKIDYKKFIEKNFKVLDKTTRVYIPFKLNDLQSEYIKLLEKKEYTRDLILKFRQVGLSDLILAIITTNFILEPYTNSIVVSFSRTQQEETKKRVEAFLQDYLNGLPNKDKSEAMFIKAGDKVIENSLSRAKITFANSNSMDWFRIGCGESLRNVFLDEFAFFNQKNIFEGLVSLCQSVPQEHGNVFVASTFNVDGQNLFEDLFDRKTEHLNFFRHLLFTKRDILSEK
jgi:hypothetical protein